MTEARYQLADTQAQLAEARQRIIARQDIIAELLDSVGEERRRADAAEARLEAVKATLHLDDDVAINPDGGVEGCDNAYVDGWDDAIDHVSALVRAALSVAS